MPSDFEIGRVVAVDTAQITIELNSDMKALTRSTYEHTVTVGQINSYVILPVGAQKIVGMVIRVMMTEEAELKVDKTMVTLPSVRRLMKATMIGSIDGGVFKQGISVFPVLDNPVLVARKEDLDAIFDCRTSNGVDTCPVSGVPGYCIDIGQSAVFPDYRVRINPDLFFGKHAAVLGSTGSGKSCSVAAIIQSVLADKEVKHAHFVILDTNGEYRNAFQKQAGSGELGRRYLHISADANAGENGLAIPYWFMNSEELARLFRAAPAVQRPVLTNALSTARLDNLEPNWVSLRWDIIEDCHRIMSSASTGTWQERNSISVMCDGVISALEDEHNETAVGELIRNYPALKSSLLLSNVFRDVKRIGGRKDTTDYDPLGTGPRQKISSLLNELLMKLATSPVSEAELDTCSADSPRYFSKYGFRFRYLENAISRGETNSSRVRENCSTMLMRIYRLFEDRRFEFLFGPIDEEWPEPARSLATFLRDILGLPAIDEGLSDDNKIPKGTIPYYDRQRSGASASSSVVVIDLSLLASEVLENVTALIARIILEFLQRLSTEDSGVERGALPVVLVLEEAQNYIRESRGLDDESISREVFERIAREGRKFGLSLVVASQRPSELSKTVLSQCNSFVVHRLQNPEDLRYFKEIVPGIYEQLLGQLPALAQRNALVLGECVRAPALVRMREANPQPDSRDPKFYEHWVATTPQLPDVEAVCAVWEGRPLTKAPEKVQLPITADDSQTQVAAEENDPFAD